MAVTKSRYQRLLALLGCAGCISLAGSAAAPAQFAISTPFNPYSSQNLSYSYPTVVNPSLPNQSRIMNRANQFSGLSITDGQEPYDLTGPSQSGRGVPYYNSFRPIDGTSSSFAQSDERVAESQSKRDSLYLKLSQERDPAKREKIKKELKEVNATLDKELGRARRRTGQVKPGTTPRTTGAGTRAQTETALATAPAPTTGSPASGGPPSRGTSLGLPRRPESVPGRLLLDEDAEVSGITTRGSRATKPQERVTKPLTEDDATEAEPRVKPRTPTPNSANTFDPASPARPKRRPSLSESASYSSMRQRGMGGPAGSGGLAPASSLPLKPAGSRTGNNATPPKPTGGLFDSGDGSN